jgi:hypothetical protein
MLVLMGFLDWLTTILGLVYFGAVEVNPLFAGLTETNILAFSGVKLSVAVLVGLMFYKAYMIEGTPRINLGLEKRFIDSGCFVSLMALTAVVTNNILAVVRIL